MIFNKDGTLLDFHAMWGAWIEMQMWKLETRAKVPVRDACFRAMGYDWMRRQVARLGALSTVPKRELSRVVVDALVASGMEASAAQSIVTDCWDLPDPVTMCRPRADVARLFHQIKQLGIRIAVCTTDSRASVETTLAHLQVKPFVDAIVCGDDEDGASETAASAAPNKIAALCSRLGVRPRRTVMVRMTISCVGLTDS